MATTVTGTKSQPTIVFDKLHIDSFTFKQERATNSPKAVGMSGVLYGLDDAGEMVCDKETFGVSDTDINSTIVLSAVADGRTVEEFMTAYAIAKAEVSNEITTGVLDDAKLMAYFEAAFARIFELHGKISVAGVE